MEEAGLPLPRSTGRPRSPLTFAAPLPVGIACRAEVADLLVAERLPAWWLRERLRSGMPDGMSLVRIDDVWLGAPAVASAIRAADYTIGLWGSPDLETITGAASAFMAATSLVRRRPRGGGTVPYDIRPLVASIKVDGGPSPSLRVRVRFHPDRGSGRPDEVAAALEELAGKPISTGATVRERVVLDGWP